MSIDILAIGSRGDVQPYVALGVGLRAAGYGVRLVTLGGFEDFVRSHHLDHLVIADSPQQIANTQEGREWVKQRSNPLDFMRGFVRVANAFMEDGIRNYWHASHDAEVIIASPMGLLIGEHLSEKLRVPLIRAQYGPPVLRSSYDWRGQGNFAASIQSNAQVAFHAAFAVLMWNKLRRRTNEVREKILGLPPLTLGAVLKRRRQDTPTLAAYSPAIGPQLPDWPSCIHITGYWFLEDAKDWTPSQQLADFLSSGPPPLFVGFGDTPFPEPAKTSEMIVRAIENLNQRAILVAGRTGLPTGQLSPRVLGVDVVPYAWLFKRVCGAVHQGGAGVTGIALSAGIPSVTIPVFVDHPFWSKRVFQVGAGPKPIPVRLLTQKKLEEGIRALSDEKMRQCAADLGKQIRQENGVGNAVQIIGQYLRKDSSRFATHAG